MILHLVEDDVQDVENPTREESGQDKPAHNQGISHTINLIFWAPTPSVPKIHKAS